MNSQQQTIHFTMEVENNNQIAFLDTLVHRDINNRLMTAVYIKPTHTDQYIIFDSNHPENVKSGVVRRLYDRASNIVTKPRCISTEKQHIQSALMSNGYSKSFIQRIVKTRRRSTKTFKKYRATAFLPFIDRISRQLRRRLESQGIRTVLSSNTTIWNYLVHPKDPLIPDRRDGIVHRIPCGSCNEVYIGETGRPVGERILEHRTDVRLMQTDNSAIVEHTYDADHLPNSCGFQCITHDRHWYSPGEEGYPNTTPSKHTKQSQRNRHSRNMHVYYPPPYATDQNPHRFR